MRKRIVLLLFILVLLLACLLFGCSKRTMESIFVKSNSFKENYTVDEAFSPEGAYLVVCYSTGEKEEISISSEMIDGFDTSTTGNKTLTVSYKGLVSEPIAYRVYNPEEASREILTRARLLLYADGGSDYIDYTVRLSAGGLPVTAVDFTLTSETSLGIEADQRNLTAVSDSFAATYAAKLLSGGTKLKTVVFYEDGRTFEDGSVVVRFRVQGGSNRAVRLTNITVSDGENDYYLPVAA